MAYASITRAQLRARLQAMYEAAPFWTDDEANRAINRALRTWNMLTGRWQGRVTLATTPGNYDYAITVPILYRARVLYDTKPLSPTSITALNMGRPGWWTETTASGGSVPTRPMLWAPISLRLIAIWPADATGHHSLTIDGVADTPVLAADGGFVNLPEADVALLLGYALHLILFKKGGVWFQQSLPKFTAFLQGAAEQNAILTTSAAYRRWAGLTKRDEKPLRTPALQPVLGPAREAGQP